MIEQVLKVFGLIVFMISGIVSVTWIGAEILAAISESRLEFDHPALYKFLITVSAILMISVILTLLFVPVILVDQPK